MIPDILITSIPQRHKYLKLTIKCLSDYKGKIVIVIPDHKYFQFLKKIRNKNIKIVFSKKKYRVEKVWEGLKYINSKSILQMGDDDLYDLQYIYEAGKILEKNSKIVAVDCFYLAFDHNIKKYVNDLDALKYKQVRKKKFKISGKNYYERIKFVSDNLIYNKRFHSSVIRSSLFNRFIYLAIKYQKNIHTHFTDQLFFLYFLMEGEIYTINKLGSVYSVNQSSRKGYYFHKNLKKYEFYKNFFSHKSSVKIFIQIIKKNLNVEEKKDKIILKNFVDVLTKINLIHLNNRIENSKLNNLTTKISKIFKIYYKSFKFFKNHFIYPAKSKSFQEKTDYYFENLKNL